MLYISLSVDQPIGKNKENGYIFGNIDRTRNLMVRKSLQRLKKVINCQKGLKFKVPFKDTSTKINSIEIKTFIKYTDQTF